VRFEHRNQPLLAPHHYRRRVLLHASYAALALSGSLAVGVAGYHWLGGFGWIDSILNASMILGGMGPVDAMHSAVGKLFAAFYALYSGLVLVGVAGLLLAPFMHRLLHRFHLEGRREGKD